jgi:hypothetical protein
VQTLMTLLESPMASKKLQLLDTVNVSP